MTALREKGKERNADLYSAYRHNDF